MQFQDPSDALEDRLARAEALAERMLIFGDLGSQEQVYGFMAAVGHMTTEEAEAFLTRETERRDMEEIGVTPDPRP